MCYAIPGKVESIENNVVTVSYFGEIKKARNELEELLPGDYIYAQGGFVIEKIDARRAQEVLSLWKEMFFSLQEVDVRLSHLDIAEIPRNSQLSVIVDKALEERDLANEELGYLLNLSEESHLELLFKTANFLRQKYHKNSCCVHGIIEISNYCHRNCSYCGISNHVSALYRYRMTKEEIVTTAVEAVQEHGFKALVLQSGEDRGRDVDELAAVIKEIKNKVPVLLFISFGEIGESGLKKLYAAGARGLLLRFETSNPLLYARLHPAYSLDARLAELRMAQALGYLLITGSLIGLPGQTKDDIVGDLRLAAKLSADMFSFGPFLPSPHTPLRDGSVPSLQELLKVLSLARILDPQHGNVVVTTALETMDKEARREGLLAGANSVMVNVTPLRYRKFYELYPSRAHVNEELEWQIQETVHLLKSIGRAPIDMGTQ